MLYSPRLPRILAALKRRYDIILIDTPPMLHISDARILAKFANGVIMVTRAGRTTRDAAIAVNKRLEEDGTPVIGVILNGWEPDNTQRSEYGSYDDAYYGPEAASPQTRKRWPA
jgi:Mrp family chromosome partitioning ATPase